MGVDYLLLSCLILRTGAARYVLVTALLLGGVSRLALLFSTPILETDFYRYLWDGAVTATGHDPYRISPKHALAASVDSPENAWAAEL